MRTTQNIISTYKLTTADRTYLVMPLFHVHVSTWFSLIIQSTGCSWWSTDFVACNKLTLIILKGLLCGFLSPLAAHSSITLPRSGKFSASVFWHDFVSTRCNWYTSVPTIHSILLNAVKHGKPEEAGPFQSGYQGYGAIFPSSNCNQYVTFEST
jgi:acyl-CoA synthetase (AMP-forming)/AMP-acid ligase II